MRMWKSFALTWPILCLSSCGEGALTWNAYPKPMDSLPLSPQEVYGVTVHRLVTENPCAGCHREGGAGPGAYADPNLQVAYQAAVKMPLFNSVLIEESKIVRKLKQNAIHNCETRQKCDQLAEDVTVAIGEFSSRLPNNDFVQKRIESSRVPIEVLETSSKPVAFELNSLKGIDACTPFIELNVSLTESGVVNFNQPRLHINCERNIRLSQVQMLLNGAIASTTLLSIDMWVKGPTPAEGAFLMESNSASGTFSAQVGDWLSLGFGVLEYAN